MMKKPKSRLNFMTCIVAITVVASVGMIVKGIMIQPQISANNAKLQQINKEIGYENQRIKEIDSLMAKSDSDEYIEKVAREKLGMIKSDEIVFVDISGQ